MKKIVIHITESLDRGGAELFFVNYINALPDYYTNIVVYLREPAILLEKLTNVYEVHCLQYYSKSDFLHAVIKLKKLIKYYQADIVHSHLYWPTLIARMAKSQNVYLISSVHNLITKDAFEPNRLSKVAEKVTAHLTDYTLFVSEAVKKDYESQINLKKPSAVLYNFIGNKFTKDLPSSIKKNNSAFNIISVGNLRYQKNSSFLIDCFAKLNDNQVQLHIYGAGTEEKMLMDKIKYYQLENVRLMGSYENIYEVLGAYDAFVLASRYEGFCLAMVEAMAAGLPCLVSDISVLREVSENSQLYFNHTNVEQFISCLLKLRNNQELREELSRAGKRVASNYSREKHISKLVQVYEQVLRRNE